MNKPIGKRFLVALAIGIAFSLSWTVIPIVTEGCSLASAPIFGKLEQIILADILANKTDTEIEFDVATVLGLTDAGTIESEVVAVIMDVTQMLIDAHLVPGHILGETQALHSRESFHLLTLTGGGH